MTIRSTFSAHHRLVLGASVMVVAVVGVTALATSALFTDTATVSTGSFAAGTVSLTAGPATMAFALPAMAPGGKVYAPITVTNTGSLAMRYSMTSVATSTDAAMLTGTNALNMTIKTVTIATNCTAGAGWTGALAMTGAAVGPMDLGAAGPGGLPIIGDIASGNQTSDQTVLPGVPAAQFLCVEIELPTGYTGQGQTASASFTFTGEQTKNN